MLCSRGMLEDPLGPRARGLLERLPVDELNIMKGVRYIDSPWTAPIPEIRPGIRRVSKSDNHSEALKAMFLQHFHEQHTDDEIIYNDRSKTETRTSYACVFGIRSIQHKLPNCASVYIFSRTTGNPPCSCSSDTGARSCVHHSLGLPERPARYQ